MTTPMDADADKFIKNLAAALKEKIKKPEWAAYVKTGFGRDRTPDDADWWYIRAASIMRNIYRDGPVGTNRLRTRYGNNHRRGHKPARHAKGGGKIIRTILQDLEKSALLKKSEKPKGRALTVEGQKFLNSVVKQTK